MKKILIAVVVLAVIIIAAAFFITGNLDGYIKQIINTEGTAAATAGGLNLSAKVSLKDSGNTVISQKSPSSNAANNDFVFSGELPADTYYLTIENQSYDTNLATGFDEYGNGGFYQILSSGIIPPIVKEDDDDLLLMTIPILAAIKGK